MQIFNKKQINKILELSNLEFNEKLDKKDKISISLNKIQDTLENSSNEKIEMASNLSHELKTPLAALSALSENLADNVIEPTPMIFEQILNHCEKMSERISFMLDLTNISKNNTELNISTFELRGFLDEIVRDCIDSLHTKQFKFIIDISPNDLSIKADNKRLSQVIENLVTNAMKYSNNNSDIILHSYIDKTNSSKKNVIIDVINEGEKIEDKSQIFNRFFTRNSTSSGGGTGIGLSISRWIMQLHKGSLVCLEDGSKNIFRASLPIL